MQCLQDRAPRFTAGKNTQIQKKLIYKHKYTNTQLYNHKYANTNTQGQKGTECKKLFLKQTGKYGNFSQDRKTNYGLEKPSFVKKKIFCEITS